MANLSVRRRDMGTGDILALRAAPAHSLRRTTAEEATAVTSSGAPQAAQTQIFKSQGGVMAASKQTIGYIVQLGGIGAFTLGAIFSVHHMAIGAAFLGGAVAFYVGQKIRALA
jgi:hypothetical protein